MRRLLILIAIIVVAGATYWAMSSVDSSDLLADDAPTSVPGVERPAEAELGEVRHVHDGDTLFLQPDGTTTRADEWKVRLVGIDTPELRPTVECYGEESRDALQELLPDGSSVWFAFDTEPFDQYDRALLYLWNSNGTFVNLELIEQGYAEAVRIGANDRYWPELSAAEDRAYAAGMGRWGSC